MELGKQFKTTVAGREVVVTIGKYAEQANGSCMVQCGDTIVMTNVAMSSTPREGMDFFPLQVEFEEKLYAVGKIPGSFKRREGRASDKAVLTSRLIDRPIRPLFPEGFFNDVVVICTAISVDTDIAPEVYGMLGSSIALSISDIPFDGPTGSVVVGLVDGEYVLNPNLEQRARSKMHVTVSGTKDAIMMVEAGANFVSEEEMLNGIMVAHEEIKKQVAFINEIVKEVGKAKKQIAFYTIADEINQAVREYAGEKLDKALATHVREERQANEEALKKEVKEHFATIFEGKSREVADVLYEMTYEKVREKILNKGERPDGRKPNEIRKIWCETGMLPRVHGSAVFTRGQSQAMTTATLGMLSEVQILENLDEEPFKRYLHHYNFPGYSTGEAKAPRTPGRREIGHGALAERALEPVIPCESEFPYAIRTVSEILSSNGSTSQASICGSTLALMDAGVPLLAPVAGIAMGLIKDTASNNVAILSDIQGLEDFLGDMDFKVAGTEQGITAIQMDIKIKGIDRDIMKVALEQARIGRLHILGEMLKVLPEPREELSKWAPKIISFQIDPEKIGDVIGKSGKVIKKIMEDTGVKIDIEDSGRVCIATNDAANAQKAKRIVLTIAEDVKIGDKFEGSVVRILEFGAFVELAPGKDGMVHISKLSKERVEKVTDVINIGDIVEVEVIPSKNRDMGKIDLRLLNIVKKA